MNSIQYAMARAAYEAYWRKIGMDRPAFDSMTLEAQRCWLAAAMAVFEAIPAHMAYELIFGDSL